MIWVEMRFLQKGKRGEWQCVIVGSVDDSFVWVEFEDEVEFMFMRMKEIMCWDIINGTCDELVVFLSKIIIQDEFLLGELEYVNQLKIIQTAST